MVEGSGVRCQVRGHTVLVCTVVVDLAFSECVGPI